MRLVLDTNVFVSALLSATGAPAEILRRWREGAFVLVCSEELLREVAEVLRRRRFRDRLTTDQVEAFLEALRTSADVVGDPEKGGQRASDPKDDFVVDLAEAAGVDALVTGDASLRDVRGLPTPILSPRGLVQLLDRMDAEH